MAHRDFKSENLLFSKSGTLKLGDFGFSAKLLDEKGSRNIFDANTYVGSPEYNPPELTNQSFIFFVLFIIYLKKLNSIKTK